MMKLLSGVAGALAAGAIAAAPAAAADAPAARKPGLWEIAVTVAGQPSAHVERYCIGADDDIALKAGAGVDQSDCTEAAATAQADGLAIASVCRQGNSTVTLAGLLTGDLSSAYRGEVTRTYSPPLYGRTEIKSTIEARRTGDCP